MLEDYQNAAEIIVLIVYAVVVVTILVGAIAGLRIFFGKRGRKNDSTRKI
jgi:hypothetical protein